jgi:ribosomal protein S27E
MRYCCPVTGSFVLLTAEASLCKFSRPTTRLRCAGCGELHFVAVSGGTAAA